jgi:hypothetical protein
MQSIEDQNKCEREDCFERPTHVVYWPGKNHPPRYCEEHARTACSVLADSGVSVVMERISRMVAVCSTCGSRDVERDRDQEHPGVGICRSCGPCYITDIGF